MTFWILLATAGFLTVISLRYNNILYSLAGSLVWIALWMYNLSYPPANIVIGSTLHEVLVYTFIIMAIATMYMYFRNRGRTSRSRVSEGESGVGGGVLSPTPKGLMDLSPDEYRRYLVARMRGRRR